MNWKFWESSFKRNQLEMQDFTVISRAGISKAITKEFICFPDTEDPVYTLVSSAYFSTVIIPTVEEMLEHWRDKYGIGPWRKTVGDCEDRAERLSRFITDAFLAHNKHCDPLAAFPAFDMKIVWTDNTAHMVCMVALKDNQFAILEVKNYKVEKYVIEKPNVITRIF